MDVVIFCGGRGTRLSEKTGIVPKPLVPIGEKPILWHIMKTYEHYGHRRFILTLGYKGEMIKDYFVKYPWLHSSFEINLAQPLLPKCKEKWLVLLKDTGEESKIGKRLNMIKDEIKTFPFLATYGDGLADIDINKVIAFHDKMKKEKGAIATITLAMPCLQYGVAKERDNMITEFTEKPRLDKWVNIGFMVFERGVFKYVKDNEMDFDALKKIAADGKLAAFKHEGFFASMDTYRNFVELNELWKSSKPWKVWQD